MSIRVPQHSGKLPMRSTSILLEEHWEKRESSTTWYQLEIKGAGTGLPASSMEIVMDCVPDGSGTQSESTASSSFHLWCGASNLIWPGSTGAALARSGPQPAVWPSHGTRPLSLLRQGRKPAAPSNCRAQPLGLPSQEPKQ